MPSAQDRLYYYQQIASAKTTKEVDEISGRLIDQFGGIDDSIDNLFIVAKLRCLLSFTLIEKCTINKKELGLFFRALERMSWWILFVILVCCFLGNLLINL